MNNIRKIKQKTHEEIIEVLGIAFNFTMIKTALYEEMLRDIPPDALETAISYVIKTSELPPTVACIRKAAEDFGGYIPKTGCFYGQ